MLESTVKENGVRWFGHVIKKGNKNVLKLHLILKFCKSGP